MLGERRIYSCSLKPFLNSFIHRRRLPLVTSTKSHICEIQEGVTKSDYLVRWWCVCSYHRCPQQRWESAGCKSESWVCVKIHFPIFPTSVKPGGSPLVVQIPFASLLIPTVLFPAGSQPLRVNHVNALGRPRAPADPISSCQHIGLGLLSNSYCVCSPHRLFLILFLTLCSRLWAHEMSNCTLSGGDKNNGMWNCCWHFHCSLSVTPIPPKWSAWGSANLLQKGFRWPESRIMT